MGYVIHLLGPSKTPQIKHPSLIIGASWKQETYISIPVLKVDI